MGLRSGCGRGGWRLWRRRPELLHLLPLGLVEAVPLLRLSLRVLDLAVGRADVAGDSEAARVGGVDVSAGGEGAGGEIRGAALEEEAAPLEAAGGGGLGGEEAGLSWARRETGRWRW